MIDLVIVFLVLALAAGLLGFTGIEIISIEIARVLFFIFLVLFIVSLVMKLIGKRQ